ncbi:MAG: VOC family protein [Planctomycetes bacterium]|nr:VOC family protein [Planctomycetota bacterium]
MKKYRMHMLIVAGMVGGCIIMAAAKQTGGKAEFSRTTIDLGMVVSDVEKTAKFYTEAIGFKELSGFDVSAQMANDTGLTDNRPFKVRVFVLGDEPAATRLKIMTIPGANSKKVDNQYIGSSLGFRYLTINVANLTQTMARLKKNGVAPVKEPYQLGGNSYLVLVKDPDGNTVELIGPQQ